MSTQKETPLTSLGDLFCEIMEDLAWERDNLPSDNPYNY